MWTRGLAWAMCGFAEQLEFLAAIGEKKHEEWMVKAAKATCDFYIENTPTDGVPYWATGFRYCAELGDYLTDPPSRLTNLSQWIVPWQRLLLKDCFGLGITLVRLASPTGRPG